VLHRNGNHLPVTRRDAVEYFGNFEEPVHSRLNVIALSNLPFSRVILVKMESQSNNVNGIPEGKGAYLLVIRLEAPRLINVGRLGAIKFEAGGYIYTGSALGGLKGRIERHFRREKKFHWHIDYLLEFANIENVVTIETGERLECCLARTLNKHFQQVPGFGSSDCKCRSHLFYGTNINGMAFRAAEVMNLVEKDALTRRNSPLF
jgi:Uri superfamily endonuclease